MALDEGRPAGRDGQWGVPIGRAPLASSRHLSLTAQTGPGAGPTSTSRLTAARVSMMPWSISPESWRGADVAEVVKQLARSSVDGLRVLIIAHSGSLTSGTNAARCPGPRR